MDIPDSPGGTGGRLRDLGGPDAARDRGGIVTDVVLAALFTNLRWLLPGLLVVAFLLGAAVLLSIQTWAAHKTDLRDHTNAFESRVKAVEDRVPLDLLDQLRELDARAPREGEFDSYRWRVDELRAIHRIGGGRDVEREEGEEGTQ
jgi:hypothetical protein